MSPIHVTVLKGGESLPETHFSFTAPFTIGRDTGCHVMLSNPLVSRVHAEVVREEEQWILTDRNSTNGLWINGARVQRFVLSQSKEVELGRNGGKVRFDVPVPVQAVSDTLTDHATGVPSDWQRLDWISGSNPALPADQAPSPAYPDWQNLDADVLAAASECTEPETPVPSSAEISVLLPLAEPTTLPPDVLPQDPLSPGILKALEDIRHTSPETSAPIPEPVLLKMGPKSAPQPPRLALEEDAAPQPPMPVEAVGELSFQDLHAWDAEPASSPQPLGSWSQPDLDWSKLDLSTVTPSHRVNGESEAVWTSLSGFSEPQTSEVVLSDVVQSVPSEPRRRLWPLVLMLMALAAALVWVWLKYGNFPSISA